MTQTCRRSLRVLLGKPRGFCAGVVRAIDIVERALDLYGAPVYVRHQIVHNTHVVDTLRARGAVFVDEIDAVPPGALVVFSAHGVARVVETAAAERGLDVIDATCPLVTKVHKEGQRYADRDFDVVLIGHEGHPEVEGTRGRISGRLHIVGSVAEVANLAISNPERVAYVTQTTLSLTDTREIIAALRSRFPAIIGPDTRDICYATQNRQNAVAALASQVELILVVGSRNSSNSNRLREIGEGHGVPSYLIDGPADIDFAWLRDVSTVGITAGASAPEYLVDQTIARLAAAYDVSVATMDGRDETIAFRLPARLLTETQPAMAPAS